MPYNRPTLEGAVENVRGDFATRFPGADTRTRRSPIDVFARVIGYTHHTIYGFVAWLAKQLMADTAETDWLVRHGNIFGVTRKPSAYATGVLNVAGTAGAQIPAGAMWQRTDGTQYLTDAAVTIGIDGTAEVVVTAMLPSVGGNAVAATPVNIVSPVAGVVSQAVVSSLGMSGGADDESDDDLRARVLARIQWPPHGGSRDDYEAWALSIPGVTRAWTFPLANGPGSVIVRFMMDDTYSDGIPQSGDVATVQAYIDLPEIRPVQSTVTVAAPIAVPVSFTITVYPDTPAVRQAIENELRDLIRREAVPAGTLLISHIREAVSVAAGEYDHSMTAPTTNQVVTSAQINTFGMITWS